MKNLIKYTFITLISGALLSACAAGGPFTATDNPVGSKVGEASYKVILGIFITDKGDASLKRAAQNGGISKIATVDTRVKAGFFTVKYTTIVTGE